MWLIVAIIVLAVTAYFKVRKCYKYWEERYVPYRNPQFIFGNMAPSIFRRQAFLCLLSDMYKLFRNDRYFGFYQFLHPILIIKDPELIKEVTVKEFDTFPDHRMSASKEADPLWNKTLFAMTLNDGWQDMRATLSPSFTSSKMRMMFTLMQECSKQFIMHFKGQEELVTVELKDTFSRFANDVITTTALGVECNSLRDRQNNFLMMGKELIDFSGLRGLIFLLTPPLVKLLKLRIFSERVCSFFRNIIKETLKIREEKKIVRPDVIHLLMEAKKGRLKYDNENVVDSGFAVPYESEFVKTQRNLKIRLTDEDILAQALVFFFGGFHTTASLMSCIAYELAVNPVAQEKLRSEVDAVFEECKGKITYESLLGMKYLDNVVTESLRLHAPAIVIDRVSSKPFTIQPVKPEEKPLQVEVGTNIWIPVHAIHMNSEYYPNPEKFDPDRFGGETKHNVNPYTYLPFGVGPRNCIGSRFALLENKLIIAELLRNFLIVPVDKTVIPFRVSKSNLNPLPDEGIWVGLKARHDL